MVQGTSSQSAQQGKIPMETAESMPALELMSATPTGMVCKISHEAWAAMLAQFNSTAPIGDAMGKTPRAGDPRVVDRAMRNHLNSRASSSGETGIILNRVLASYDLSNYPYDSGVSFTIETYIEINGVRRLIKVRKIPE